MLGGIWILQIFNQKNLEFHTKLFTFRRQDSSKVINLGMENQTQTSGCSLVSFDILPNFNQSDCWDLRLAFHAQFYNLKQINQLDGISSPA